VDTKLLRRETKEYVPRFLAAAQIAKDPGRFGFTVSPQTPMEFEEVVITRPIHLKTAAQAAGVTHAELKLLNPELRKDMTPPDPAYLLKVPLGSKKTFLTNLPAYQDSKRVQTTRARSPRSGLGVSRSAPQQRQKSPDSLLKPKSVGSESQAIAKATP